MKSSITFFLVLSLIFSSFFSLPPKKAEAFLGDSVSGTAQLAMMVADAIARAAAQAILQRMINSTVEWARSGFQGNPAYAVNPKQYFTDIADGVAGTFIARSPELGFLCSPFQAQIRLALQQNYIQPEQFQCTLTQVVGNIDNFYNDFNQGGWDGWFTMTQNSSNNPYGAYLDAQVALDQRIASKIGLANQKLDWNSGFLSQEECLEEFVLTQEDIDNGYGDEGYVAGDCYDDGVNPNTRTVTPGATIKAQLDKVLPSTMDRFINAQHLEDLIAAFVTGALNRYVFSNQGLFSDDPPPAMPQPAQVPQQPQQPGGALQACLQACTANYCPSGDPNDASCDLNALISCANTCNGNGGGGGGGGGNANAIPPNPNWPQYDPPGVCASDAEIAQFLLDNPGDEGRLPEAFPCN